MKNLHMKNCMVLFFSILLVKTGEAQYYYRDVLLTNQNSRQLQQYKSKSINSVKILSFEGNKPADENFSVEQKINNDFTQITTISRSSIAGSSELIATYSNTGNILSSTDTSEGFRSITKYAYTPANKIAFIKNTSFSPGGVTDEEDHVWIYNEEGAPVKMLKIKNQTDTTTVTFELDEEGRIGTEHSVRNGRQLPVIYYYYDDSDRLTDIVRFNEKARRLLPDLIFEYYDNGQMKSMMIIPEGSDDYMLWVYTYGENGLKTKETCFNKDKNVLGYVKYEYK